MQDQDGSADPSSGGVPMLGDERPPSELSLVEIAQRLEQVTSLIESERVRERDARKTYREVADEVEANIAQIRAAARSLLDEQRRRMGSFEGMLNRPAAGQGPGGRPGGGGGVGGVGGGAVSEVKPMMGRGGARGGAGGRLSLADAILQVWTAGGHDEPLTTPEIAAALTDLGYTSKATARSMKSTMNQTLAKLSRSHKLRRFRSDGSEIPASDRKSRARRYLPA